MPQVFGGHGERVDAHRRVRARRWRVPGPAASRRILHCLLDPEAITPGVTLQSIRDAALAADA